MIHQVIEQHAAEAAFLWTIRARAVTQPHYDLRALYVLDERIEANLDALLLAGDVGWGACVARLDGSAGATFAATAIGAADPARLYTLLDATRSGQDDDARREIVSGLAWLDPIVARRAFAVLLETASGPARHILGIAGLAAQRMDPGEHLGWALCASDPRLVARALLAAGELGRADLLSEVRRHLVSGDPEVWFAAAWTLALLGDGDAARALAGVAEVPGLHAAEAATVSLRRVDGQAAGMWLQRAATVPGHERIAILGAGASGDPQHVPWLLTHLDIPELARAAGEAFTLITGASLEHLGLHTQAPEGFDANPSADPDDENVAPDPDLNLPWPHPERVRAWWLAHRGGLRAGTRHLLGQPIEVGWLQRVLREGSQRHRHAAALELAVFPPRKLFEVRAPAFRQRALLG